MPHLLLSAAKVIVFLNIQKKGSILCLFSDKNGVLFCILFYLVYLCRNDDEKVIRTDSWIIKINNDNETCFFDNGSWQFTASQGIAVNAR